MPVSGEFLLPVRVYYEDTDAGGVVYHSKYLNYFERGRTEMLRTLGFEQDCLMQEDDVIFAVRSVEVEYHKPARFNNELQVTTRVEVVKKASMTFRQALSLTGQDTMLCELKGRVACLTASTLKPRAIPGEILNALEASSAG